MNAGMGKGGRRRERRGEEEVRRSPCLGILAHPADRGGGTGGRLEGGVCAIYRSIRQTFKESSAGFVGRGLKSNQGRNAR